MDKPVALTAVSLAFVRFEIALWVQVPAKLVAVSIATARGPELLLRMLEFMAVTVRS